MYQAHFKIFEPLPWLFGRPIASCPVIRSLCLEKEAVTLSALERELGSRLISFREERRTRVWGRDTSVENVAIYLQKLDADVLITGHIPCPEGYGTPNEKQLIVDSMGTPACCCLFPADRVVTYKDLVASVVTL